MITAILSWTATQNVAGNSSTITASLKLKSNSTLAPVPAWNSVTASITINGNTASSGITTGVSGGNTSGSKYTRTVTVPHNADGTKKFSFGFSINFSDVSWNGSRIGTVSHSGSGTLNTIPRASSISSISGNQIGGSVTVNISRASSSFKHIIKYTNTAGQISTVGENVDTSKTFTISMSDCSHLPNTTSGTAKITVDTYSGNSRIGSATKNHTVYVPDSVKPIFEWVTIKELSPSIKNLNLGTNRFVQGKSSLELQVHGSGQYGSTITKASVGITDVHTIASNIGTLSLASFPWAVGDNLQLIGTVTDSRGRTASGSARFSILPFSNPVIHSFSANRIDNGTSVDILKKISASRVDGSKTGYIVAIDRKINGAWTQVHSENTTNTENITLDGFDLSSSHELRIRLGDYFQEVSSITSVSTSKTLFDLDKDVGVGIGKMRERGVLDVGGSLYVKGYVEFTTATANKLGTSQNVVINFKRNNGIVHSGFDINGENDALRLHQYNASGGWVSAHTFYPNGNVDLTRDLVVRGSESVNGSLGVGSHIWSGSYITATGDINTTNGIILENGKRVATKTHQEGSLTFPNPDFSPYNSTYAEAQHPKVYTRDGVTVTISGAIKNNIVVASGWSGDIAQLPSWAPLPRNEVNGIAQGSYNSIFLITIRKNGRIGMTRYRDGNTSVATPVGSWLNVSFTYSVNLG